VELLMAAWLFVLSLGGALVNVYVFLFTNDHSSESLFPLSSVDSSRAVFGCRARLLGWQEKIFQENLLVASLRGAEAKKTVKSYTSGTSNHQDTSRPQHKIAKQQTWKNQRVCIKDK
jgi:hypothetical protein